MRETKKRAEQDDVLFAVKEVELSEVQDGVLGQRALEGEVELLDRCSGWEPRGFDPALAAVAVAAVVSVFNKAAANCS